MKLQRRVLVMLKFVDICVRFKISYLVRERPFDWCVCVLGGGVQDIQDLENSIVHFALYAIKKTYINFGMLKIDPRKGV